MSKAVKISLIVAAVLVALGVIVFVIVMTVNGWNFSKNSAVYETNEYEITDGFDDLSINTETADIVFLPSDDERCRVICYERQKMKHSVSVIDGVLTISVDDQLMWYDYWFSISFKSPKITVYLPESKYASLVINESTGRIDIPGDFKFNGIDISASTGDVNCRASSSGSIKIKLSTGDVLIENLSAKEIDVTTSTGRITFSAVNCDGNVSVNVSTGKVQLTDVRCRNLNSDGSTGTVLLKNVIAVEGFSIERSTGDVGFDACDAAVISVKTDTGDVTGSLLSSKIFITRTDTGKVDVPKTVSGGVCEITTDTGNIRISILEA